MSVVYSVGSLKIKKFSSSQINKIFFPYFHSHSLSIREY